MKVSYGSREIHYTHKVNTRLKHAYITVDSQEGVILKSPEVDETQANRMVLKKASWIIEKLQLVTGGPQEEIVSGSRLYYLGRAYYTNVIQDPTVSAVRVSFNHSSFKIQVPTGQTHEPGRQTAIERKLEEFYRQKAIEKITPRVANWIQITGLKPKEIKFRKLNKRWGSCTRNHIVIINIEAVKLPFSLIDYIIVHELCHILHTGHNRKFRQEVDKYLPASKYLETRIIEIKL